MSSATPAGAGRTTATAARSPRRKTPRYGSVATVLTARRRAQCAAWQKGRRRPSKASHSPKFLLKHPFVSSGRLQSWTVSPHPHLRVHGLAALRVGLLPRQRSCMRRCGWPCTRSRPRPCLHTRRCGRPCSTMYRPRSPRLKRQWAHPRPPLQRPLQGLTVKRGPAPAGHTRGRPCSDPCRASQ